MKSPSMEPIVVQGWTTIFGDGTTPIIQSSADWTDFARFADAVLWLEVRAMVPPGAGDVVLSYETSPIREGRLFRSCTDEMLSPTATPVVTKIRLADAPAVPLARWLRWSLR